MKSARHCEASPKRRGVGQSEGLLLQQQSVGVLLSFTRDKFVIAKQVVSSQKEEQTRK